ncbi:RING/U-box superfamily protein [Actinidia rufa]|uniref:RING/U-box superfamily protein n=1 Tax=Actinidia rufa TaxID=165716 RepID=A0A7J0DII4_9ERIC|nr:RING/U-box superfamily protein [Actinidia rufa]
MNLRSRILGDVNSPAKEADNSPKTQKNRLAAPGSAGSQAESPLLRRWQTKASRRRFLKSIPKLAYTGGDVGKFTDCAICLAEFVAGDEIRVLPPCGHGFHVGCIDTWLRSHSSCPSCRQLLVAATCRKCGGMPGSSVTGAETQEGRLEQRRQDDVNVFLP